MPTEVYHQSFTARLEALSAIAIRNADQAERCASEMRLLSAIYGRYSPGAELESFSVALSCLALQWRWVEAIRSAEPDADRYQKASRLKATEFLQSNTKGDGAAFDAIIADIQTAEEPEDLPGIESKLASTPLPFSVTYPDKGVQVNGGAERSSRPKNPEIAFVKFEINGESAKIIDTLAPNVAHDMALDLRVSNWPSSAERLIVEPVSLEPSDCYELPKFVIEKPKEPSGPITFGHVGRLILKIRQPLGAKPFEFKYRAVFDPPSSGLVDLLGHRTLKLESVDPSGTALSGYANIDARLIDIRRQLKSVPGLLDADIISTMTLLSGLGNLAGQALQSAWFPTGTKEAAFQDDVLKHLRRRSAIGSELEEHPHTGGGITDLSFRQIRLELKADTEKSPTPESLSKDADQTAHYVVTTGKKVGVLCVLDSCAKDTPPVPAESLFSVQVKHLQTGGVPIVTLIVQGGLPKPSSLSR